jgi:hypothetical protein
MSEPVDPLAPDAPLIHLLSIKHNPLVKDMSNEQLADLVKKLRTHAASAPTLSAKLQDESDKIKPRNTKSAKRKAMLDAL